LRVRWLEGDLRRLAQSYKALRSSNLKATLLPELPDVLAAFDPRVRGMYWSWRDPLPGLNSIGSMLGYWLLRRAHRLRDSVGRRGKLPPSTACGQTGVASVQAPEQ
jgi:hypothetical protein